VKFANLIIDSKNPKLELAAILKSSGVMLNDDEESGEELGNEYGITRQAISKKLQSKKKKLGLPPITRDSKKVESREVYRKKNKRNYSI
jgi:hypothetical protein